ncbi:MAG: carbohydrate porin [Syntrophothermus sp.]
MKIIQLLTAVFLAFLTPLQAAGLNELSGGQNCTDSRLIGEDSTAGTGLQELAAGNSDIISGSGSVFSSLKEKGLKLTFVFTGDAISSLSGGINRKTHALYRTDLKGTFDLERLIGWNGAGLYFDIMGTEGGKPSLSSGAGQGISNIEAPDAWKIFEFYLTQSFLDDRLSLLLGTFDFNSEFDTRLSSAVFLNPSHGIGPDISQSGKNGPSIFPTTSLALRASYKSNGYSFKAAVFDGIPGNPENPTGTYIILNKNDGVLLAVEADYISSGEALSEGYKKISLGGWYYSSEFEDLTELSSGGKPIMRRNNFGLYIQGESFLFSEKNDPLQGLAGFMRFGIAESNINKYSHYLGVGLNYTGLFSGRDSDILGFGIAAVKNSSKFMNKMARQGFDIADFEVDFELTYQMHIFNMFLIQPDIQYVADPVFAPDKSFSFNAGIRFQLSI